MRYDFCLYPGRGTGMTKGLRLPAELWHALRQVALAAGAPDPGSHYPPYDGILFGRAVKAALAAPPRPLPPARPHVPAGFQRPDPVAVLKQDGHVALVAAALELFSAGEGVTVERVLAGDHRALSRR